MHIAGGAHDKVELYVMTGSGAKPQPPADFWHNLRRFCGVLECDESHVFNASSPAIKQFWRH